MTGTEEKMEVRVICSSVRIRWREHRELRLQEREVQVRTCIHLQNQTQNQIDKKGGRRDLIVNGRGQSGLRGEGVREGWECV